MNNRRRFEYQSRELDRLREENKELSSELKVANKEIARRDSMISELESAYEAIKEKHKQLEAECSEAIAKMNEARSFYDAAAREARDLSLKFKKLIADLGIEIKHI